MTEQAPDFAAKVSASTGVPQEFLAHCANEDEALDYARRLDQFAHPKPTGMPNQGEAPQMRRNQSNITEALFG
jgi:hypothetical protein